MQRQTAVHNVGAHDAQLLAHERPLHHWISHDKVTARPCCGMDRLC